MSFGARVRLLLPFSCAVSISCSGAHVADESPTADTDAGASEVVVADESDLGPIPPASLDGCTLDPGPPTTLSKPTGPTSATYSIDDAMRGFPGEGRLTARITNTRYAPPGVFPTPPTIVCVLATKTAPRAVAAFVGLARGTRPHPVLPGGWAYSRYWNGKRYHLRMDEEAYIYPEWDTEWLPHEGPGAPYPPGSLVMHAPYGANRELYGPPGTPVQVGGFSLNMLARLDSLTTLVGRCEEKPVHALTEIVDDMAPVDIVKVEIARCP